MTTKHRRGYWWNEYDGVTGEFRGSCEIRLGLDAAKRCRKQRVAEDARHGYALSVGRLHRGPYIPMQRRVDSKMARISSLMSR